MKNNTTSKSIIYPQGLLICPICGKEFEADDDTRYIISGGYTCSWKCFLTESKRRNNEKNAEKQAKAQKNKIDKN